MTCGEKRNYTGNKKEKKEAPLKGECEIYTGNFPSRGNGWLEGDTYLF